MCPVDGSEIGIHPCECTLIKWNSPMQFGANQSEASCHMSDLWPKKKMAHKIRCLLTSLSARFEYQDHSPN